MAETVVGSDTLEHCNLNNLAARLNEICRSSTFDLAHRVGSLIIEELYGGDETAWLRDRGRRPSYRALARRSDLLLGPSALCRSVGVFVLTKRLGGMERWRHVTSSHIQEVLPLPPSQQYSLIERAEAERWTVAATREAARASSPGGKARRRRCGVLRLLQDLRGRLLDKTQPYRTGQRPMMRQLEAQQVWDSINLLRGDLEWLERLVAEGLQSSSAPTFASTESEALGDNSPADL